MRLTSRRLWIAVLILFPLFWFASVAEAARTITAVSLNGSMSGTVTVEVSSSIAIEVFVRTTNPDYRWRTTSWSVDGGPEICVNTKNFNTMPGDFTDSFTMSSPASEGTHTFEFIAYEDNGCGGGASAPFSRQFETVSSLSVTPVSAYYFDESSWDGTSGEVSDEIAGNNGTVFNGANTGDDGQICRAASFDGNNDYLEIPNLSDTLNGTASMAFWIRTTQAGNDTSWLAPGVAGIEDDGGVDDIFWGWLDAAGHIGVGTGNNYSAKSTTQVNDGDWHHVALTRNAGSGAYTVYIDGVLENSGTLATGSIGNSYSSIGRMEDSAGTPIYFAGDLDELYVYDSVIDSTAVAALFTDSRQCEKVSCSSVFTSALQNTTSAGRIIIGWNGQILNDPDNQLETANSISYNSYGLETCGDVDCTPTGTAADSIVLDAFATTSSTNDVNLAYGYGTYSLADEAYRQLSSNGNGTVIRDDGAHSVYHIAELNLGYQDQLILQGGHDYWIENLNFATENVISVEGSGTARLYLGSDVDMQWAGRINTSGAVGQLLVVAYGNVNYAIQNTETKFLLYSAGNVTIANNAYFNGAIAAAGDITLQSSNARVVYSSSGVASIDGGGFCAPEESLTCFNDDFNRTDLGSDWAVSSRYGSFGTPRIVNNRLRLTDSSTYVATVASLLRLFPGAGNKIIYEFDQYAYNGSGADGMTVVLSDASVTPVPGGYGGSLGYAQRSGQSGFTGGWLGMAIDEFGNFANDNEGRGDGGTPTARVLDSVTVRGSGAGMIGYLLHGNSGNLLSATGVGIDNPSSTAAAYGHRYRVTVDHTDNIHAYVTIDRDINDGSGYQTIIGPYDAMVQTNQAAVPTNWLISMTGSTGGSRNIHEIDNLQVCATYMSGYNTIDHYRIYHDGSGLTCSPEYVTVQACMDADCTVTYAGQASVVLTTSSGWNSTQSFLSDLSNNAYLRSTSPGAVTFNVVGSSSDFVADNSPRCFIGTTEQTDCTMTFYDSGFIFDVPDHVAATSQSVTLSAVRTDVTTQQCVPGFASVTHNLAFSFAYDNPTIGTLPVSVNSNSIASGETDLALSFDANGETTLDVSYADVGQITLAANYAGSVANGDDGLVMTGNDSFITRPDHFDLTIPANPSPVATNALGGVLTHAGDNFNVEVSARNANGDVTPNYGREVTSESVGLSATLVAPAGQSNPGIAGSFNAFGSDCDGVSRAGYACGQFSWSEVGIITLAPQVADGNYLGSGNVTGNTSENVGRFIPAYFSVADNGPSFADANGSFTYLGQPFSYLVPPRWTVSARNRSGGITSNYGADFWHLNSALTQRSYQDNSGSLGGLTVTTSGAVSWSGTGDYDGTGLVSLTGEYLSYVKTAIAEGPLNTNIDLILAVADLTDSDTVCYDAQPNGTCDAYKISAIAGTEQRYGQLLVQNAYGPETMDLTIPVLVEYFNGSAFVQNIADSSTTVASTNLSLSEYTGILVAGDTTPVGGGTLSLGASQAISLSAPLGSHEGSVKLDYNLSGWPWLRLQDGTDPTARASFGIYKGNEKLIYMRESLW